MDHRLEADADKRLFLITTQGEGSVEGIIAFLQDLIAQPLWRPGMNVLLDHRKLSIKNISAEGVIEVSSFFTEISDKLGTGKLALVMNQDVDFGIARAWELQTEDRTDMQIKVFRSLDKAYEWLSGGGSRAKLEATP